MLSKSHCITTSGNDLCVLMFRSIPTVVRQTFQLAARCGCTLRITLHTSGKFSTVHYKNPDETRMRVAMRVGSRALSQRTFQALD